MLDFSKCPIIGIIGGIVLLGFGIIEWIPFLAKPIDPNDTMLNEFKKGEHVRAEVYVAYDYLLTEELTKEEDGQIVSSTERYRYYGIPYFETVDEGLYIDRLLVVKVPRTQFGYFELASDRFEKWWMDTDGYVDFPKEPVIIVDGVLKPMKDDEAANIERYFNDGDYTDYVVPYVLTRPDKNETIGGIVAGLFFLGLGLFFYFQNKHDKEEESRLLYVRNVNNNYYNVPEKVTFDNDSKRLFDENVPPE